MIAPTSFFSDYGCHVRILEEVRTLQKLGHKVKIVTYHKGRDLPELDIVRTRPTPWHADYEVGSSRHKIAFDMLLSWTSLKTTLRFKPHIIHAHLHEGALIGWMLSKIGRAPLVFDFQGSLTSEMVDHRFLSSTGRTHRLVRWLERRINHMPHAILTSSYSAASLLRNEFGVDPERVIPMPDCVDTDFFSPRGAAHTDDVAALRAKLGIPPDRNVVVYLGLLAHYQGTEHLLKAAQLVIEQRSDVHFLVMGYPSAAMYKKIAMARGIGNHVSFTGKVLYEQAPRYLRVGDVAVAPKLSMTEANGKVLNYMASGLPVVAFDTPVNHEYMRDYGLYARRGDAASLAAQLLRVLDQPDLREQVSARLRARAESLFSWEDTARRIVAVYDAVRVPRSNERTQALRALNFESASGSLDV